MSIYKKQNSLMLQVKKIDLFNKLFILKNTVFIAEAVFADDAKETACDKIKRLIKNSLELTSASNQDTSE